MAKERRAFQRLELAKPILATMRGQNALVLDLGIGGAFVEHYGTAEPGETFNLTFRWQGEPIEFVCRVAHSVIVRNPGGDGQSKVSHTGVDFSSDVDDAARRMQHLITTFVARILDAQRANASGDSGDSGAAILASLGEARRIRSRGYVSYRLKDGTWWRIPTESPAQPDDGFTVCTFEDEDELADLCRTYEQADENGRRLIRLVAELATTASRG